MDRFVTVGDDLALPPDVKVLDGHLPATSNKAAMDAKAPLASPSFTGTVSGVSKTMVGLGNVDNTADSAKPVSTAQQAALDAKAPKDSPTFTGTVSGITKSMVGLGNVDNTADAAKPVSIAQATALAGKLDTTQKGAANGVASLGADGKVPAAQLPAASGSGSTTLAGLTDIDVSTAPTDGEVLTYNAATSKWKPGPTNPANQSAGLAMILGV